MLGAWVCFHAGGGACWGAVGFRWDTGRLFARFRPLLNERRALLTESRVFAALRPPFLQIRPPVNHSNSRPANVLKFGLMYSLFRAALLR